MQWLFHGILALLLSTCIGGIPSIADHAEKEKIQIDSLSPTLVKEAFERQVQLKKEYHLFFRQARIDSIREGIGLGDPLLTKGFQQLQKEAQEILKKPLLHYYLDDAKLRIPSIHQFASQVPVLIMMYQITHEVKYAERCWQQFELMAAYPDWGANRHFLDAGIGAFDAAMIYDGLKNYLSSNQKALIRETVTKQVLLPAKKPMQNQIWWHIAHHNWNGICNGGIIMACLSMMEADPIFYSYYIAAAARGLPYYLKSFEPDGQSEEGLMYWRYGLMYTTITLEAMHQSLGTCWGLDQFPGFSKAGWFPYLMSGPVTSLSVGDDPIKTVLIPSFFWFAKYYQNPALAQWQKELLLKEGDIGWMDMLFYDRQSSINQTMNQSNFNKTNYLREIELVSIRSQTGSDAHFISMHGGRNNANHGHLDAGSFDIQADGEVWAYGCLGRDDYTFPGYFSKTTRPGYWDAPQKPDTPGRWHFYRLRAEGKNCLVFGPDARPDQFEQGSAKLIKEGVSATSYVYSMDLGNNYIRDAKTYIRTIQLDTNTLDMWVVDQFTLLKPKDVWWSMHTKAKIQIQSNGRQAYLSQNGKTLVAEIEGSPELSFQQLEANYLPGQNFPLTRNSENKGFTKLAIHQSQALSGQWRVRFYMLKTVTSKTKIEKKKLQLASILQDHMVLQQDRLNRFWGTGLPGRKVTLQADWHAPIQTTVLRDSSWTIDLPVPKVKKGNYQAHQITLSSYSDTIHLRDILLGEVWLCSGQSNMDMTMQPVPPWHQGVTAHEEEIKEANYPNLRLLKVQKETNTEKQTAVKGTWVSCTPAQAADFSGVAYYFGRRIQQSLDIPVGLIVAAYGSAACQAFMDRSYLEKDTVLKRRYLDPYDRNPNDKIPVLRPTLIYNAMIHPLGNLAIRGFLWYQGESNGGEYALYARLCGSLIQNWRTHFRNPNLPFYFVQMTPYNWKKTDTTAFDYALFREAQSAVQTIPHTGMVVTMDVGEPDNIHPNNKKPVGERLALLALKRTYHRTELAAESPYISQVTAAGNELILSFQPNDCLPLQITKGTQPLHFLISENGRQYFPATVNMKGNQWRLHNSSVTKPLYVRYAFTNSVVTNVVGTNGLPLMPFRNDTIPSINH
jgi:hypothetical protein